MQQIETPPDSDLTGQQLPVTAILRKTMLNYLEQLNDPRREAILEFHNSHKELIHTAWGSKTKHQAWPGGYVDHLASTFRYAELNYQSFGLLGPLPFTLDSAIIVLNFHDVEKIWARSIGLPPGFDKDRYLFNELPEKYKISFSADEQNALHYVHGESEADYDPYIRKAGPLAAFCHIADHASARIGFDDGRGLGSR